MHLCSVLVIYFAVLPLTGCSVASKGFQMELLRVAIINLHVLYRNLTLIAVTKRARHWILFCVNCIQFTSLHSCHLYQCYTHLCLGLSNALFRSTSVTHILCPFLV